MRSGLFVAGTDTGVGKTITAVCLALALDGDYWKPVQAGLPGETDTGTARRLSGFDQSRLHPPAYELRRPLSPHQAARLDGVCIDLDAIRPPRTSRPLVVEGAGGLLSPLNDEALMIDLAARLGLPVVLVARSGLGTINHTLLSLEALASRSLPVLGVIVNGPLNKDNANAIRHFGRTRIIMELEPISPLDAAAVKRAAKRLAGLL